MGAWGTGPFDNDAAGDWFDGINQHLLSKINRTLKTGNVRDTASEWYAAAGLLAGLEDIVYRSYGDSEETGLAIDRLAEIIKAAPDMGWHDTARFVEDVQEVKHNLELSQRRIRDRRRRA